MDGIHRVRTGDSPWKVAQENLKRNGKAVDNDSIVREMQRLAELNGCKNVDDLASKFFNNAGSVLKLEKTNGAKSGNGAKKATSSAVVNKHNVGAKSVNNADHYNRIKDTIVKMGHKSCAVFFHQLSKTQKSQILSYTNLYKAEPRLIMDINTKEVYAVYDLSKSPLAPKTGLKNLDVKVSGNRLTVNRYYRNGKIVQDNIYPNDERKNTSKLMQAPYKKNIRKKHISTPLKIDIKVNPQLYKGASVSQRNDLLKFVSELEKQKANLMSDLEIDNDTYNRFVRLAIGIAAQESGLEKGLSSKRSLKGSTAGTYARDTMAAFNSALKKAGLNNPINKINATAASKGLTQIKIGDWDDNPRIKKLFEKYGITRGYYNQLTPEQSAAATIIVLNDLKNKVQKTKSYQDGIEAANYKYYKTNKVLENGNVKDYPGGFWRYNKVTEDDAILYLYNGRSGALKNGNATPEDNLYTHNVRRYTKLVQINENKNQRAVAVQRAKTYVVPTKTSKKMKDDLGWGIGQIVFRPDLYTEGANRNSREEIAKLKNMLITKGYDINSVNKLATKMMRGELSFAKKLTDAELESITPNDLNLIIRYSDSLNVKLKTTSNKHMQRRIATSFDKSFKSSYLASHAKKVPLSSVSKSSIKLVSSGSKAVKPYPSNGYYTGAQQRCKQYLPQLRGSHKPNAGIYMYQDRVNSGKYTGFCVEKDKGINYANASDIDILLAQNGADTANTLRTSGACLTGAKQALIGSGAVTQEEMRNFNNAFQLAKFLEKHPNRFIEVSYVKIDGKTARELTAGDLKNLPAGCIIVFGNRSRTDVPGHAGISTGNGQMYADEVDNTNWDNFVATNQEHDGKGEHGYFRIFRLNPAYYATNEGGKKLVKK